MGALGLVLVIGGAAYLLLSRRGGFGALFGGVPATAIPSTPVSIADMTMAVPGTPRSQNVSALIGVGVTTGKAIIGATTAGGTSAAAGGTAGVAGGISTTAALAAAGVAAGAAILAWGIIARGWLRGGEEALHVNPARDAWFDYFVQSYYPGAGSGRQFDAFVKASIDAGVPGDEAERLLSAVYAADTRKEFEAATAEVTRVFEYFANRRTGT